MIGCGTYVGFDHAPGTPEYAAACPVWSARFSTPAARLSTARRCMAVPNRRRVSCCRSMNRVRGGLSRHQGVARRPRGGHCTDGAVLSLAANRSHRPDADPQPAGLENPFADGCANGRNKGAFATLASPITRRRRTTKWRRCCEGLEPVDFLQINYALDDREVERRILPLVAERGVAVIGNRPFGGGGLVAAFCPGRCPRGPPRSAAPAGRGSP